jgi:homoserine dehydrogenase
MSEASTVGDAQPAPSVSSSTSPPPRFCAEPTPPRLRVGLIGFGKVGRAFRSELDRVADLLVQREGFKPRLVAILARDRRKERDDVRVGFDDDAFFARPFDVVVDAAGDAAAHFKPFEALLHRGVSVVTAGKVLAAERGAALDVAARRGGATFGVGATVAAGTPLLRLLDDSLRASRVRSIEAVLNGTTNVVLERVAAGATWADAIAFARAEGLCERDPSEDLSGRDAARKLRIVARRVAGRSDGFPIDATPAIVAAPADLSAAARDGRPYRHLASLEFDADGAVRRGRVAPVSLPPGHPLTGLRGPENGIVLETDVVGRVVLVGPGAGPLPTASALIDDLVAAARRGLVVAAARASAAEGA